MPRIDRKGLPLRAKDGHPIDDLGRLIDASGRAVDEDGRRSPTPTGARCRSPAARRVCDAVGELTASTPRSTAPGSAAAAGSVRKLVDCCSLQHDAHQRRRLADRLLLQGPQACSASCTSTRRSSARDRAHPRRGGGRRHRRLVPVRLLDGRHARAARLRRAAAHHDRRVRDVLARRARRRRRDVRRAGAARAGARGGRIGGAGRGGRDRAGRGGRRGARRADPAAGAPPGAGVVAAADARAARGRALRRAARARLHDLHPHVRGVGARGRERRDRRPGARASRSGSRSAPAGCCR